MIKTSIKQMDHDDPVSLTEYHYLKTAWPMKESIMLDNDKVEIHTQS